MTYYLSGIVEGPTGVLSNVQVDAYLASRFPNPPVQGQAPPAGGVDAGPVTPGPQFGGPGQWQLAVQQQDAYYVHVAYPVAGFSQTVYNHSWALDDSLAGAIGAQGPQGYQGDIGAQGYQGDIGPQGSQGYQGNGGPQGVQGFQGTQGTQGTQGFQGAQGIQGLQGAQGFQGVQGVQGTQGNQGVQGRSFLNVTSTTSVTLNSSIDGTHVTFATPYTGAYLAAYGGQEWVYVYNNAGVSLYGQITALSLDTSITVIVYSHSGTGTYGAYWTFSLASSPGSPGTTGPQGVQGSQGATGSQGAQGIQGYQGAQGATGAQGSQGYQGTQGLQGSQGGTGTQGSQGVQGANGFQGNTGAQGAQGSQGATGTQGATGAQGSQGYQGNQGYQGTSGNQGYPVGLTGATTATRYVGGTTNGAPTSGTFAVGDFIVDQTGTIWVCTTAGTPGTWTTTISNHLSLRSATATVGRNEITIFSGSTASQTLTAPSNPIDGSNWTVINKASVAVTLSFTPSMVPLSSGTGVTTFSVPASGSYSFVNYNGSQWYMVASNSADQLINVLPTANGGTGLSTIGTAGQALVVNSGATGLTYTTVVGTQGAQGAQGSQGSQGTQGTQGAQGNQGTQGTQGTQGAQGAQGAFAEIPPSTNNLVAWVADPILAQTARSIATGGLYFASVWLQAGTVVTNVHYYVTTAGGTVGTQGQIGLFDTAGYCRALTATNQFTGSGASKVAFAATYTIPSTGVYYVGWYLNSATTAPILSGTAGVLASAFTGINVTFTANQLAGRYVTISGSGLPSVGSQISGTPGNSNAAAIWFGLS